MAENLNGVPFVTTTITIKPAYDRAIMEPAVKKAWIALRHSLPAIAVKSSRLPAPDSRFTLAYHVPKNHNDIQAWVDHTVFFPDQILSVYEMHKKLRDDRWWRPANGHWVGELYVSPIVGDGWQLSTIFNHNSIDGRSCSGLLDELLMKLGSVLEGSAEPISELRWGEETKRLPPASMVINAKAKAYPKKSQPHPLSQMIPWTWAPAESSSPRTRDVSALVTLSVETTSKLHSISKLHGRTISEVVNALSILAHAETSLTAAAKAGSERFKTVFQSYKESEVYKLMTTSNYRHKFPEPYNKLSSETPGPLATYDSMPLYIPMDLLRKFFRTDNVSLTVSVNSSDAENTFWNGLVDATAKSWKEYDLSLQGYATRDREARDSIHRFDPSVFHYPALTTSSLGDMGRLNIFNEYLPSKGNKTLTVVDFIVGQRVPLPEIKNIFWQYDGKLSCHWSSGGKWRTEEEIQLVVDSFQRWIGILFDPGGKAEAQINTKL
ncbi:hypothetical protein L218DRAFT_996581 [Marasmius fiardii PR-910]|nr:hypothetical protein L218DRAFT_996581 [Marasmius fiardii PR-910]